MSKLGKIFSLSIVFVLTSCGFYSRSLDYESGKTVEGNPIKHSFKIDEKSKVLECLDKTLELAEAGKDYSAFESSYTRMSNYFDAVSDAREAEQLKYYMYGNEEAQSLYLEFYELLMTIINKANKIHYAVYENDFKYSFYEGMSDEEIIKEIGPKYSDEYYEKNNELKAIEAEYNNLDDEASNFDTEATKIYVRYVNTANEVAKLAGYDNFLDFSYENYYYRPYTYEVTDDFFNYAKEYALPYFVKLYTNLESEIAHLSRSDLNDVRKFVLGNGFTQNFGLIEEYKDYFGGEFKTIFNDLWYQSRNYYISYENNAMETAFTSMRDEPYVFFGKRYEATTIVHEFGHYYDYMINGNTASCYDLAETQSQADEMLFINYIKVANKYSDAVYKVIIDNQYVDSVSTILMASMVNEIEKKAYLDDELTLEDLSRYEKEVMDAMPSEDILNFPYYWKRVVVNSPCYYFSYATSAMGALEIATFASSDLKGAISKYNKLINYDKKNADNYLKIYEEAGFSSPFIEATFKEIFK